RGSSNLELAHQEREALFERSTDRLPSLLADAPHPLLERTYRFFARLVDELLFRVLRLALLDGMLAQPCIHLRLEVGRKLRMLVNHVLKICREMDLARADSRERVEGIWRKRRGAVLHGAGKPVLRARHP